MAEKEKSTFKDKLKAFWGEVKKIAKRVWEYLKVAKMEWIVLVSLFALDLISKTIINAAVDVGETVVVIPYVLNFHSLHNSNAAFGASWLKSWFGPLGSRIFFCVFSVAASVIFGMILVRQKGKSKVFRIALAMLIAGAMGNCIDRWALGYVRDFVEWVYFGLTIFGRDSFYVFNIADAELIIGVVLVIVFFLFIHKDKEKAEEKKAAKLAKKQAAAEGQATAPEAAEAAEGSDTAETTEKAEKAEALEATEKAEETEEAEALETTEKAEETEVPEAPEAPETLKSASDEVLQENDEVAS